MRMPTKKTVIVTIGIISAIVVIGIIVLSLNRSGSPTSSAPVPVLGSIELPKAPYWDVARQCMFFVDVYKSAIHKYVPSTNTHTFANVGTNPMAFVIPINGTVDRFIVSYGDNLSIIQWDGNSSKIDNIRTWNTIGQNVYRANEGKVSPSGALFVGTHSPFNSDKSLQMNKAHLYVFYPDGHSKILIHNVTVANGMAWSKDKSKFFFIDSLAYTVQSFSYNITDDSLSNGTVLLNFKDASIPGVPDGMAIDDQDKLWVTSWQGHQAVRIDPETRSVMETIHLDAYEVTSALFGGAKLNDFYLTTGKWNMSEENLTAYPHSGYIFEKKDSGMTGFPGVPFTLNL